MNNPILESRLKLLTQFAHEFGFFVLKTDAIDFLKRYEKKQLAESKKRVKAAKKTFTICANGSVFHEIITKMNTEKITVAELARRMKRSHQQVSQIIRTQNATLKTINLIKEALNDGSTTV